MGGPKLQLEIGGQTFLAHVIRVLRAVGITKIVCVVSDKHTAWVRSHFPGVTTVENKNPRVEMLTSVKIGVDQLNKLKGALVVPVDHPCVTKRTYRALLRMFAEKSHAIVKPTYQGSSGHPVLIPRKLFDHIRRSGIRSTLNELIKISKLEQVLVPCDDPGILKNINTPEDVRGLR